MSTMERSGSPPRKHRKPNHQSVAVARHPNRAVGGLDVRDVLGGALFDARDAHRRVEPGHMQILRQRCPT